MKFDELFEQRSLVASKLKECIRDMGLHESVLCRQRRTFHVRLLDRVAEW